jgi:hypothetical protein
MPDPLIIASAAGALKTTFDAVRSAIGMLKDAKELLPTGDQRGAAISQALVTAESSSKIAEAEIAKALGYELCKCEFPPTPMLTVGYHTRSQGHRPGGPVFECPKCGFNSARPFMYERTVPERENPPA